MITIWFLAYTEAKFMPTVNTKTENGKCVYTVCILLWASYVVHKAASLKVAMLGLTNKLWKEEKWKAKDKGKDIHI